MRLLCPWCRKAIQIDDELEGALVQCPECDCRLIAPTLGIHVKPSAPSVPDYYPTEADWEKPAAQFTMRQLLDTLKQATEAERREFLDWDDANTRAPRHPDPFRNCWEK